MHTVCIAVLHCAALCSAALQCTHCTLCTAALLYSAACIMMLQHRAPSVSCTVSIVLRKLRSVHCCMAASQSNCTAALQWLQCNGTCAHVHMHALVVCTCAQISHLVLLEYQVAYRNAQQSCRTHRCATTITWSEVSSSKLGHRATAGKRISDVLRESHTKGALKMSSNESPQLDSTIVLSS